MRPPVPAFLLLLLLSVSGAAGCIASGGPAPSTDEALAATPNEKAAELAALFKKKTTVQIPPLGSSHGANTLAVDAEVAQVSGSLLAELRARVAKPLPTLGGDTLAHNFGLDHHGPSLSAVLADASDKDLAADDMHATLQLGLDRADIERYIVDSLTAPSARSHVAALLGSMSANYAHFMFWDQGSEINAQEIFLIQPLAYSANVVVIYVGYAEA